MNLKENEGEVKSKRFGAVQVALITSFFTFLGVLATTLTGIGPKYMDYRLKKGSSDCELLFKEYKDSIDNIAKNLDFNRSLESISLMYNIVQRVKDEVTESTIVNVYYLHDTGDYMRADSPIRATLIYESNAEGHERVKSLWQSELLPEGYFNYNKYVYIDGIYYIPDVSKEPDVYFGLAKNDMDSRQIKSLVGAYIGGDNRRQYFLTVCFDQTNPLDREELLIYQINNYSKLMKTILNL